MTLKVGEERKYLIQNSTEVMLSVQLTLILLLTIRKPLSDYFVISYRWGHTAESVLLSGRS